MEKLLREVTRADVDEVNWNRSTSQAWCEKNGWVWPREQQFLHVVEETGELVDEILERTIDSDLSNEIDELWDLWFTYLTFIDNKDFHLEENEKFAVYRYILKRTKWIDWMIIEKEILLRFITEVSRENKVQRKLSGRKDNFKYSQLDVKKSQALSLFFLSVLSRRYCVSVSQLINSAIEKYEGRDIKK